MLSILQDTEGFMWFGTEDGVNRFDGYDFQIYSHDSSIPESIPDDYAVALAEDEAGNIWIGTHAGGVSRWLRESDSFRDLPARSRRPVESPQRSGAHADGRQPGTAVGRHP